MEIKVNCPPPTQDKRLNARNRVRAFRQAMYGPIRLTLLGKVKDLHGRARGWENRYWHKLAHKWGLPYEAAIQRRCGNCGAFDTSQAMVACGGANAEGSVGYCRAWNFSCAARRTCLSWSPRA